jgi:hypothetical protein
MGLGSGKKPILDPGVKKAPEPKSRIPDPDRNTGKQFTNKIRIWIRIIQRGPWIRIQGGTMWLAFKTKMRNFHVMKNWKLSL